MSYVDGGYQTSAPEEQEVTGNLLRTSEVDVPAAYNDDGLTGIEVVDPEAATEDPAGVAITEYGQDDDLDEDVVLDEDDIDAVPGAVQIGSYRSIQPRMGRREAKAIPSDRHTAIASAAASLALPATKAEPQSGLDKADSEADTDIGATARTSSRPDENSKAAIIDDENGERTEPSAKSSVLGSGSIGKDTETGVAHEPDKATNDPVELSDTANTEEVTAAESTFMGTYRSLAFTDNANPTERKQFIDGKEVVITVNPEVEFVQERFEGAQKSIEPLAASPIRSSEIRDRFLEEARLEADSVYVGNSMAAAGRVMRAEQVVAEFIERASQMFADGAVDGLTIRVFFDRMQGFKYGLSSSYNSLVRKTDEPMPAEDFQDRYAQAIGNIFAGRQNVEEQKSGGYVQVNSEQHLLSDFTTTERYYISPTLNGNAAEAVKIWAETVADLGLADTLYYKVATGLSRRYDTIVAYASPETAAEMQTALEEFTRRCPVELLSDSILPGSVKIAKGIARTPEPHELNTLLRYRGKETLSYSEYACALTELSLRRASYDFMGQDIQPDQLTPGELAKSAQRYFVQFVKLSGLDPLTMRAL
jgi:hypothetical protein